ncbi:hypothetical protein NDU88_003082 [Pleurodeles waltl]|uniref:Uncharacterized protein n=1 Tax=Pleurodeles waltl TaxID=8319 RepID=A0AAV7SCF0_PLEWA|nr:hypothetical protein NDU88_003082 [Pleurodeles waltl]
MEGLSGRTGSTTAGKEHFLTQTPATHRFSSNKHLLGCTASGKLALSARPRFISICLKIHAMGILANVTGRPEPRCSEKLHGSDLEQARAPLPGHMYGHLSELHEQLPLLHGPLQREEKWIGVLR